MLVACRDVALQFVTRLRCSCQVETHTGWKEALRPEVRP